MIPAWRTCTGQQCHRGHLQSFRVLRAGWSERPSSLNLAESQSVWEDNAKLTSFAAHVYLEAHVADASRHDLDAQVALAELIAIALEISELRSMTGREKPTVITWLNLHSSRT